MGERCGFSSFSFNDTFSPYASKEGVRALIANVVEPEIQCAQSSGVLQSHGQSSGTHTANLRKGKTPRHCNVVKSRRITMQGNQRKVVAKLSSLYLIIANVQLFQNRMAVDELGQGTGTSARFFFLVILKSREAQLRIGAPSAQPKKVNENY